MALPSRLPVKPTVISVETAPVAQETKTKSAKSAPVDELNGGLTRKLRIPKSRYDENGVPALDIDIDGVNLSKSIDDFLL